MNIVDIAVNEIKPYENNPRNNMKAVEVVAQSIQEFGFKNPLVVDSDMTIINGHTRYQAAMKLGLTFVPVIVADDLSEEQIKAFRIMDNKSSEFAEWDYEKLLEEVTELTNSGYDVDLTGFTELELAEITDNLSGLDDDLDDIDTDVDNLGTGDSKTVCCPHCNHEFEV